MTAQPGLGQVDRIRLTVAENGGFLGNVGKPPPFLLIVEPAWRRALRNLLKPEKSDYDRRMQVVLGNLVDLAAREIYPAALTVFRGEIATIARVDETPDVYLLPGFVDSHVHIESSMLPPSEFARAAVRHGTVGTVSDPHEIANVLGREGVEFMLEEARRTPFKFCFGAPSCVPATSFETSGARLDLEDIENLLDRADIGYLSEVMNWPGVLNGDPEVLGKIQAARARGKRVDGHAPGLTGELARRYAAAGIEMDHECSTLQEALDKIEAGMLIAIREGSAARNLAALEELIHRHPDRLLLCCDDIHPNELIDGHINRLVARLVGGGGDLFHILEAACIRPVEHYGLPIGRLRKGDPADFIVVEDLVDFKVRETWIDGECVARDGRSRLPRKPVDRLVNRFRTSLINMETLSSPVSEGDKVNAIVAHDGELLTSATVANIGDEDVLKIVVVNRYQDVIPATGFIKGFGLTRGAIASSVAHDSHNIIAVGTTDEEIARAINWIISSGGGVVAVSGDETWGLKLEIAGLMSNDDFEAVGSRYSDVATFARENLGSNLRDPFMTLSFMALLVIPDLKMSDKGLFSGTNFSFVDVGAGTFVSP